MKIYLDTCSIQRPLDSKTQIRIIMEAEAIPGILALCETGQLELVSSEALQYEVQQTPHPIRRDFGLEVLSKAASVVTLNETVENRARAFGQIGLKALDALHVASAEADFFCTCDDRVLKKAKNIDDLSVPVVSPLELIEVFK
ncbi:MAG: nucleic acid-binding protein [Chloroflexi bacterium]|nr:MAG: nucleic acid-binding protein [Chloroflexota bacterium]